MLCTTDVDTNINTDHDLLKEKGEIGDRDLQEDMGEDDEVVRHHDYIFFIYF